MPAVISVAVIGASGFAGAEFLRLAVGHPDLRVVAAYGDTQAGTAVADLYPNLAAAYPDLVFTPFDAAEAAAADVVVSGLPHRASASVVAPLVGGGPFVCDLSADFRLDDPEVYAEWYGVEATATEVADRFVYGLPERHRDAVKSADAVALPGCYPTGAILALAPFADRGLIEPTVSVSAMSGVSGAGRPPKDTTTFCAVDENVSAYSLLTHRHTPEIEQATGLDVLFTPHLVPTNRGILSTCVARPTGAGFDTDAALGVLHDAYGDEPFVVVTAGSPQTKAVQGSNVCQVTARVDARTGQLLVISALDNLVKGTSGQAIQCINLKFGLGETTGLPMVGLLP